MNEKTIFIQIASFRDTECQWTIKDLFEKAEHPDRVFVGVCWQYDRTKDHECFQVPSPNPVNTLMLMVPRERSRGVCWARHKTQTMYDGEDYVLMIDSHMRFIPGWDTALIEELDRCESDKPILSTYPPGYTPPNNLAPNSMPTYMHAQPFDENGNLRFRANSLQKDPEKPLLGAFMACGFIFTHGEFVTEVPYDPYLYFSNEEACLAARAFTHGWDVFSPTTTFLYHYYQTNDEAKENKAFHWSENEEWIRLTNLSKQRNDYLLCEEKPQDKKAIEKIKAYGLGKKRSLGAFEKYCGINFKKRKASQKAIQGKFIKKLASYKPVKLDKTGQALVEAG